MLTIEQRMDSGCKHSETGLTIWERGTTVLRCGHLSGWRSQEQKCLTALKLIRLHLMKSWIDTQVADPCSQAASPALSPAFSQV